MTAEIKKQVLDNLVVRLAEKEDEYRKCNEKDAIFEIKKKIRTQIKELKDEIQIIKNELSKLN